MIDEAPQQRIQNIMLQLEGCGFQPFDKLVTQGSGVTGRALSADGSTWAEIGTLQSGLRNSLRELLKKGVLRGAGCTAQLTTEFNNQSYLVTTTAELASTPAMQVEQLAAETPLAVLALRHMQRIEAHLREVQSLKPLIHTCAAEVEAAQQRAQASRTRPSHATQPLTPQALRDLGVPPRLALLIAGDCAEAAETLTL